MDWNALSAIGTTLAAIVGIIGILLNLWDKRRKLYTHFEMIAVFQFGIPHVRCKHISEVVTYNASMVKVVVDEIVLADAKRPVTVTVYKDGAEFGTCTESVEGYVARNLSSATMGAITDAIIKFATSDYNYLGGTN